MINTFPYIAVLITMSLLIKTYAQECPSTLMKSFYLNGSRIINYRFFLVFIAYLIYIIFSVFRKIEYFGEFNIGGTDSIEYLGVFTQANIPLSESINNSNMEIGFTIVNWILRQLSENYQLSLFFWHSLTFILTVQFLQHLKINKFSVFTTFLILTNLISQFNTLRMSIGVCIGLIVFISLDKKKWIWSFILILIAMSIHMSSVILILVWIVTLLIEKTKKYPVRRLLECVCLGMLGALIAIKLVSVIFLSSEKYQAYLGESSIAWGTNIAIAVIFILSIIKYREMIEINSLNKVLIIALPICLICIPLQYKISIMYRMTMYFMPVLFALIPSLCKCYSKVRYSVSSVVVKIILYSYMIFRTYSFFTEEGKYIGIPYVSTLFNF